MNWEVNMAEEINNRNNLQEHAFHNGNGAYFHESLDTYSEDVQEIMGKMPSWIVRRGIFLVTIILLVIFVGAYFFKYPDVIPARVKIFFAKPPVKLVSRSSLPIQHIFIGNNQMVAPDQVLCILSNAANYADVQRVYLIARQIDTTTNLFPMAANLQLPTGLQLGDIQSSYTELYQALEDYHFFIAHNTYQNKIQNLLRQQQYYTQLKQELNQSDNLLQEQLRLQQGRYSVDSTLAIERVISKVEFEQSKKKLLDQQMSTQKNKSEIIQNSLQQSEYQKNIDETYAQRQNDENNFQQRIRDAAKRFKGQFAQWEQNYVIKSPVEGRTSFFSYWKENQYVPSGTGIMMIIPPVQQYIARGDISKNRSGKIKAGQKVLIKLAAFPFEEYGLLNGTVAYRSQVAMDSVFSLEIKLPYQLITNTGYQLPQQPEFDGTGEILTEDKSVLQRLFDKSIGHWRK